MSYCRRYIDLPPWVGDISRLTSLRFDVNYMECISDIHKVIDLCYGQYECTASDLEAMRKLYKNHYGA